MQDAMYAWGRVGKRHGCTVRLAVDITRQHDMDDRRPFFCDALQRRCRGESAAVQIWSVLALHKNNGEVQAFGCV